MTNQLVGLLDACKLLADRQGNVLLGYLISMALIEARSKASQADREKAA